MNKGVLAAGLVVTLPLILLLVVNIHRDPTVINSPLIEKPAPDVVLAELSGGTSLRLASLKGRPTVVNFWASWCVPCVQEHAALTAGARTNPDVAFVGVVYEDTAENAKAFLAQRGGAAYPTYTDDDGKAAIAFGIYGVPETFFIDSKGVIVEKYVGPLDPDTLRQRLAAARR
jgi:cytochrome c biogenesis protein CcmG/thiol:disulfide interchange protein DsbE